MSAKKGAVADAWDDDWESLADVQSSSLQTTILAHIGQKEEVKPEVAKPIKLSKAERRAQHAQFNREIWESAFVYPSLHPYHSAQY